MTKLTDYDTENPPEEGTLFKASNYKDEDAPIIRFQGQRETEVVAVHPGDPNAAVMAADPDFKAPTTTEYKLEFSTARPGGFWDEGDTKEIGERAYDGREDLVEVDEDGVLKQ